MSIVAQDEPAPKAETPQEDLREQLFNQGQVGPIKEIQVSTERITQLNGILFDLDPDLYREGALIPAVSTDPGEFYSQVVQGWLSRDPVLAKAEVRNSGRGLHAILWFDKPVLLETDADRQRWAAIVQVVQAMIPIDPDQPGITAATRPTGSVNSKTGKEVSLIREGTPVTQAEVLQLFEAMRDRPFKTLLHILAGNASVSPCPICGKEGTKLSALDHVGQCYDSCGKVSLDRLYEQALLPRQAQAKDGASK